MSRIWRWVAIAVAVAGAAIAGIFARRKPASSNEAVEKAVEAEREAQDLKREEAESKAALAAANKVIEDGEKNGRNSGLADVIRERP